MIRILVLGDDGTARLLAEMLGRLELERSADREPVLTAGSAEASFEVEASAIGRLIQEIHAREEYAPVPTMTDGRVKLGKGEKRRRRKERGW